MNIAISSTGASLEDNVHDLFGRCDCFLVVDPESGLVKAVKNEFAGSAAGAGTACAQTMFDEGVTAVISVQVGPNAYEALKQGGIDIFLCASGLTAKDALEKHQNGVLPKMEITKY